MLVEIEEKTKPSKPIYLGVAVLAYSRMHMAALLMAFPGDPFRNYTDTFQYTDTDSIVMHREAYITARRNFPQFFGTNLGQLDDELEGGKITRSIRIAPKTYWVEYALWDEEKQEARLMWKTRVKGIPHKAYPVDAYYQTIYDLIIFSDEHIKPGQPVYWVCDENGKPSTRYSFLGEQCFRAMLVGLKVIVIFTMMKKRFFTTERLAAIFLDPRSERTVNATDWWKSGVRHEFSSQYSVPLGHRFYPD